MINLKQVQKLFNEGKLKTVDAEWLYNEGYTLVVKDGKIIDIIENADN